MQDFLKRLAIDNAVLVTVTGQRGSVPRAVGTWMAVFADACMGTIGGGHLEWRATARARQCLRGETAAGTQRYALGPTLGQCCGGEVCLSYQLVSALDLPRLQTLFARQQASWPSVAVFGAGHVGQALVRLVGQLPLRLRWIDSRDEIFPPALPDNVTVEHCEPVQAAVADLAPDCQVLVMSFSHAEDLEVVAACLLRQRLRADLAMIGLIGSQSKWASFSRRLARRGFTPVELAQVSCPIGVPGIAGKEPAVIAISVAAQLLQWSSCVKRPGAENLRTS